MVGIVRGGGDRSGKGGVTLSLPNTVEVAGEHWPTQTSVSCHGEHDESTYDYRESVASPRGGHEKSGRTRRESTSGRGRRNGVVHGGKEEDHVPVNRAL